MNVDKKNGNVCFSEEEHVYFDEGNEDSRYVSVTTLIHGFSQPFDKEFWSAYKALQKLLPAESWAIEKRHLLDSHVFNKELLDAYDITENDFNREQQAILDEWDEKNREACERGTKIHAEFENSFYKKGKDISLKKFEVGGKFECVKDKTELDLENGIYPEYLISRTSEDGVLKIAGQIDLLIKQGNEITILDHKTNAELKFKSGFDTKTKSSAKMKYPLNHLDDCNMTHYQLQLSTYAWMIQKLNPDFVIKDLVINHIDHDGKQSIYHLDYLKKDVEKMLAYHRKQKIHEQQK